MQQRRFGSAGQAVAAIGQGTWAMERTPREAVRALRCGLDLGLTHVDTAEMYGDGAVEALVAEAIAGRRDEVFLVSKVLPEHATRAGTIAACERSLARLRTDRLDAYLLHWPSRHPLAETVAAFERLLATGKIRSWGVSNFADDELDEALALAPPGHLACNQVCYHLAERSIEHAVLPWCRAHDVTLVAYSPFGSGRFPARGGAARVLAAVARRHGVTPRQVALRFLLRDPVVVAIPKAALLAHVEENARADALVLEAEDVARLEAAFPRGRRRRGVPTI